MRTGKRLFSVILALAMVVMMLPFFNEPVLAANSSVKLGKHVFNEGSTEIFSFANATVTGTIDTFYTMTVSVSKGSIHSTDYTYADRDSVHKTATWEFEEGKSKSDVQTLLRGIEFNFEDGMVVSVTLSGNPTVLPDDMKITDAQINGKTHYYAFVKADVNWKVAYEAAGGYSYNGMKGYLATITSAQEDDILDHVSDGRGWAGGARISTAIGSDDLDGDYDDFALTINTADDENTIWKWICGPEAGTAINIDGSDSKYYYEIKGGSGYQNWNDCEPNGNDNAEDSEWVMEIHSDNFKWNDMSCVMNVGPSGTYWISNPGYFLEFSPYEGGYVEGYSSNKNIETKVTVSASDTEEETGKKKKTGKTKSGDTEETVEKVVGSTIVDPDLFKSELITGSVLVSLDDTRNTLQDFKAHAPDATVLRNQEILARFSANAIASQLGMRNREVQMLWTYGVYPRRELSLTEKGTRQLLLIKLQGAMPAGSVIYAQCYSREDQQYTLSGVVDETGYAVFDGYILRDAANVTLFVIK